MAPLSAFSFYSQKKQNQSQNPFSQAILKEQTAATEFVEHQSEDQNIPDANEMDEEEAEGTIITTGAQFAALNQFEALKAAQDCTESEATMSTEGIGLAYTKCDQAASTSSKLARRQQEGLAMPHELPTWFPKHIRAIYIVDRKGGALSYKELSTITRYRGLVEVVRRRKWKQYLEAGEARYKLQKILRRRGKSGSLSKAYLRYLKQQYDIWKGKALRRWKKLEEIHEGTQILDAAINVNVRQERMIYAKQLQGTGYGTSKSWKAGPRNVRN